METQEGEKHHLEDLSKEELIGKCKSLLKLAQKAKLSKENLQQENNSLKQQLKELNTSNSCNEVLEKLTEEKLALVIEIDHLKCQNKTLNEQGKINLETINKLETENTSLNRQIKRLTDENEQLISDLSTLEAQITELHKLGIQQKTQLLELEKSHGDLQNNLSLSLNEIEKLNINLKNKEKELEALKIVSKSNIVSGDFKSINDKLKEKVTLYHLKLKKFDLEIKEIKGEKIHVIKLFKDYTMQIKLWKEQLLKVSEDLVKSVNRLEEENWQLKAKEQNNEEIEKLNEEAVKMLKDAQNEEVKAINDKHLLDLEKFNYETNELNKEIKLKQQLIEQLEKTLRNNENELKILNDKFSAEIQEVNEKHNLEVEELKEQLKLKQQLIDESLKKTEEIKTTYEVNLKEAKGEVEKYKQEAENYRKEQEENQYQQNEEFNAKIHDIAELNGEVEWLNEELKHKQKLIDETLENAKSEIEKVKENYEMKLNEANQQIADFKGYKKDVENVKKQQDVAKMQEEIFKLNQELEDKQKLIEENLENDKSEIEKVKENYEAKLNEANQQIAVLQGNVKKQQDQQNEAKMQKIMELNEEIFKLKEELKDKQKLIDETLLNTDNEIKKLKETNKLNEASKQSEQKLTERSSEEIIRLAQTNKDLEEENSKLKEASNKTFEQNFTQTDEIENQQQDNGIDLKRENSEMLLEMNQMNQALKERGEIISKLEAHCEEIKKKLQFYETQANKNVDSISEKDKTIKALHKELDTLRSDGVNMETTEITSLKNEIEILREKINNSSENYAESEAMSTSTVSKSDEINQLKDLEGSWEERYGKLRTLAVKLKAKIKEQIITITELEKEREDLFKKQQTSMKTIQNLQTHIDNLEENLDKTNKENKQYLTKLNSVAENISKDKQLLVENEETISNLNKEIDKLNNEKQNVDTWKKQVGAKVQTLRKELEAKNLLIKESENKISKLENELTNKEQQLKLEQENHNKTKNLLEQTNGEIKKNSVLNLEMQDYEKSVKELSQKIEKQKNEITNLQTQLDMQKNTINALREQNKTLEERIEEEQKNGSSSTLEVNSCRKTITNLEEILQQKEDKLLNTTKLLETAKSENEELSTELSKVIAEHQKSINGIKNERDQLRNQLLSVQQNLRATQNSLKLRDDELNGIKLEYETYKVRAQSVLKKNQGRDLGLEEKLSEEVLTIRTENDKLNEELKEVRDKLQQQEIAKEQLVKERDNLLKKCKDLENEVEELKNYGEQLGLKHQKALSEHAETVRNLKIHAETLNQCYRQQLAEQETRHNREIIELQSRIDKAPSPIEHTVHPNMPREEGEGSESVESNPTTNNVYPIPLERLLDSKYDHEDHHLKKQLLEQESKLVHLTALLSDTEQDLAKHVQMNKVLKEEIRRQQRSVEREQHAENLEYLKNVVFKFVTLNSGDERTRLVPVLNTILKLSPEETHKLSMVAKGDPGLKAWASYLPTWSSPNKPQ